MIKIVILSMRLEREMCAIYKAIPVSTRELMQHESFLQYYRKTVASYTAKWKAISIICYVIK